MYGKVEKGRSTSHVTGGNKNKQDKNTFDKTQTHSASGVAKTHLRSGMGTSASTQSLESEDSQQSKISQCIFKRLEQDRPKLGDRDRMELFRMVQMDDEAAVLNCLKRGPHSSVNIEQPGPYNRRLLHAAAENDRGELVRYLLKERGANIDAQDADGWFAEHFAASAGAVNALECLLNSRTTKRKQGICNWEKQTPLMTAAIFGQAKATEYLLYQGMDVNAVDQDGDTALILAVRCGHADVAQFLVRNKLTERQRRNKEGKSAMDYAKGNSKMQNILLTK